MATNNISGLKELNDLLDSLTEPKFRTRALRNSAKSSMNSVKQEMVNSLPSNMKADDVVIKTKVNTDKKMGKVKQGFVQEDKYSELYTEVTFRMKKGEYGEESAYGMAHIMNYGRRNPLARVRGQSKFYSFGKPTEETHRYIGVTEGLHFVEKVRFNTEETLRADFERNLEQELQTQIKKQDKYRKRKNR
ncbi:hypothetical protein [Aeromonas hydrophila]|uniref:hypothetical protein n=1 Tax=Aeromonas hydrophila TaxID=644 RepID=UPI001F61FE96|nr:hypothetical protein [Aeromonas hydrophila]UNU29665.1 hypothetical protein GCK65_11365 [Aeromonas hydrophila]